MQSSWFVEGKERGNGEWETHELLSGEEPVGHELPRSDGNCFVSHGVLTEVCVCVRRRRWKKRNR